MVVRPAVPDDRAALVGLDSVAAAEPSRAAAITDWIANGLCFVACQHDQAVGYGVLHYHFFHRGMLEMVMVDPQRRRRGVGGALVRYAVAACRTPQLWTSTNQSNWPMQALLLRLGFIESGTIHGLDPGDSELIYRIECRAG